jgi:hypothetical protein
MENEEQALWTPSADFRFHRSEMELPVKKLLLGMAVDEVANPDAMANPGSLGYFLEFAKQRSAAPVDGG